MTDRILARDHPRSELAMCAPPAKKPGAMRMVEKTDAVIWAQRSQRQFPQHLQRNLDYGVKPCATAAI